MSAEPDVEKMSAGSVVAGMGSLAFLGGGVAYLVTDNQKNKSTAGTIAVVGGFAAIIGTLLMANGVQGK